MWHHDCRRYVAGVQQQQAQAGTRFRSYSFPFFPHFKVALLLCCFSFFLLLTYRRKTGKNGSRECFSFSERKTCSSRRSAIQEIKQKQKKKGCGEEDIGDSILFRDETHLSLLKSRRSMSPSGSLSNPPILRGLFCLPLKVETLRE